MNTKTLETIDRAATKLGGIASLLTITQASLLPDQDHPTPEILLEALENLENQIREVKQELDGLLEGPVDLEKLMDTVEDLFPRGSAE